ncbi:MAG: VPLPA-CTERM-specific exosortase XrtD, partial [Pseudomonadota bacterium]
GNVIDLGVYKLQVAEACSGLRYLFPLMTLGFIMAYFFHAAFWKRALLFLSSVPITILMNSFRIGVIGVLVEHYGIGQAEGFLHDFEGWVIFLASGAVLVLEVVLLASIGRHRRPWREVFGVDFPPPRPPGAVFVHRPIPMTLVIAGLLLCIAAAASQFMPARAEVIPQRASFADFPTEIAGRQSRPQPLAKASADSLMLDDYLLVNFGSTQQDFVNLYVAWYDTQRAGRSAHSPRTCLPGGGWQIDTLERYAVPGLQFAGKPLVVNRAVIRRGTDTQLVYYFFKQRQRLLTNEYVVKWYLMWDALTQNRTDGALIRVTVPVGPSESLAAADLRLQQFIANATPSLKLYLPD